MELLSKVAVREGEDGVRVERVIGPEHPVTVQRMAKTLVISGLSENTFYRVNMTAHNNVGASAPSIFIFRTGNDTGMRWAQAPTWRCWSF